jgi:glycosyltransferase involved in cell wall biosynthesis
MASSTYNVFSSPISTAMQTNDKSLVTCYLPTYNAASHAEHWLLNNIPELESVNALLLVVDNGSTDQTLDIILDAGYPNIEIVRHGENLGIEKSFRTAKERIRTKYRLFLPADDWLAPGYLSESLQAMEANDDIGVVYGRSYMVDLASKLSRQRFVPHRPIGNSREYFLNPLFFNNFIPDISLYRSSLLCISTKLDDWFKPGGQAGVLSQSSTYFTGKDQCFSGKSINQLSKQWAADGHYYKYLQDMFIGAYTAGCKNLADRIVIALWNSNFHTGKQLLPLLKEFDSGHEYIRNGLALVRFQVIARIFLIIFDELLVDATKKSFKAAGVYGSVQDLNTIVSSLDSEQLTFVRSELQQRGLSGFV